MDMRGLGKHLKNIGYRFIPILNDNENKITTLITFSNL